MAVTKPNPIVPRYVSQSDAARYLGVTDRTIRAMIADGRLTGYKLGPSRTMRLKLADLEAMLVP